MEPEAGELYCGTLLWRVGSVVFKKKHLLAREPPDEAETSLVAPGYFQ